MTDVLTNFYLESNLAQNLHVQIEGAYFSPTEYVFRRRLVVSKVQYEIFKACKPTSTICQQCQKMFKFSKDCKSQISSKIDLCWRQMHQNETKSSF